MKRMRILAVLFPALAAGACDPPLYAHVEPGSRADSLVFHAFKDDSVADADEIYGIRVTGRGDSTGIPIYWEVERRARRFYPPREPRTHFRYGELPASDWIEPTWPVILRPGCYEAEVTGGGLSAYARYVVRADGRVLNIDPQSRGSCP